MDQMHEQKKSKDFKQTYGQIQGSYNGPDSITLIFGHEEMETLQPLKPVIIIDTEVVLSPGNAKNLADQIYEKLKNMGHIEP